LLIIFGNFRAKLEQVYADGLGKLATKARKMCGDSIG